MFKDLVLKTRTYRTFDPSRAVSREEMLQLVDLARVTASSANKQPLKYAVLTEPEQVAAQLALTKWAGALPQMKLPPEGQGPAAFIVICHDYALSPNLTPYLKDVGIAAQTMALGAAEMGLGCCMIGSFHQQKTGELLHLPEGVEAQLVLAFGKPAEEVRLTGIPENGNPAYFRDENNVHWVPKRSLEDVLL